MRAPAVGSKRTLAPVGLFDLCDNRVTAHTGHTVELTQPAGCPRNGTMGHAYVNCLDCAENGRPQFVGLVLLSSLAKQGEGSE